LSAQQVEVAGSVLKGRGSWGEWREEQKVQAVSYHARQREGMGGRGRGGTGEQQFICLGCGAEGIGEEENAVLEEGLAKCSMCVGGPYLGRGESQAGAVPSPASCREAACVGPSRRVRWWKALSAAVPAGGGSLRMELGGMAEVRVLGKRVQEAMSAFGRAMRDSGNGTNGVRRKEVVAVLKKCSQKNVFSVFWGGGWV